MDIDNEFQFSTKPFSRHTRTKEILFFGMPLFGGWLPFIGFRTEETEEITYRAFVAEWFMYSFGVITHIEGLD